MTAQEVKSKDTVWENIKALVYAILLAILIRTLWLQPFHIPSGSMIPTLLIGDNLFVSKPAFGYSRYSIPFGGKIDYFSGRIWPAKPTLGEIVVFRSEIEPDTDFIKRIVGLPGDRVQVLDGILYINDVECTLEEIGPYEGVGDNGNISGTLYTETLPSGLKHTILKQNPFGDSTFDNTPEYKVPEGHYFMMGDNRDGSNDSRAQEIIGYIPFENLIGRASFIFFSTGGKIALWEVWRWPFTAHYSRIFKSIN